METPFCVPPSFQAAEIEIIGSANVEGICRPTPQPRGRRITGADAESSWQLQRIRRVPPLRPDQSQFLKQQIEALTLRGETLISRTSLYRVRPIVGAMLYCLFSRPTVDWQVSELSQAVYGRAASMRAIRQTVFRVNRAFENVGCPLAAYCHGAMVFLRPRLRTFEQISITD